MTNQKMNKPVKHKNSLFKKVMRIIFVEDWELKVLALAFAVAVWVLFKASV